MRSTLSVLGLYNYDSTIFDTMKLPPNVELATIRDNILMECAEFEVLYPDPAFFKLALQTWSNKQLPVWTELEATLHYDYNPIENYDRKENWTDIGSGKHNSSANSNSTNTGNSSTEGLVAAYNESEYQPRDKSTNTDTNTNNSSGTQADESTSRMEREGRAHGNIGVTTTQQMINEQRNVVKFNICDYIIDEFKKRFCLMIY